MIVVINEIAAASRGSEGRLTATASAPTSSARFGGGVYSVRL
jgi:hypothetical protein